VGKIARAIASRRLRDFALASIHIQTRGQRAPAFRLAAQARSRLLPAAAMGSNYGPAPEERR
jgi:hypothetical protein